MERGIAWFGSRNAITSLNYIVSSDANWLNVGPVLRLVHEAAGVLPEVIFCALNFRVLVYLWVNWLTFGRPRVTFCSCTTFHRGSFAGAQRTQTIMGHLWHNVETTASTRCLKPDVIVSSSLSLCLQLRVLFWLFPSQQIRPLLVSVFPLLCHFPERAPSDHLLPRNYAEWPQHTVLRIVWAAERWKLFHTKADLSPKELTPQWNIDDLNAFYMLRTLGHVLWLRPKSGIFFFFVHGILSYRVYG